MARHASKPRRSPLLPKSTSESSQSPQPLNFESAPTVSSNPRPIRPRVSASSIARARRPIIVVLAGIALYLPFDLTYRFTRFRREAASLRDPSKQPPADASARFNHIADEYDANIGRSEWLLGISNLRRKLLAQAQGHVLEVSVGTGRNAMYYPLTRGVKSVTMVDQSQEMVRVARMNWAKNNAWFMHALFRIQSAQEPVPLPYEALHPEEGQPQIGFDTVVQTMGVCSTGDPVAALRNLGRLTRDEGKILLLEHGRAKYEWMNNILDEIAPAHAERWGCWFNKDVGDIVKESGLEVVEERRYHFGTTWWFVLKPPQDRSVLGETGKESVVASAKHLSGQQSRPWWASWWT